MDKDLHHQTVQRALELGRGTDPAALPELIDLLRFPSTEVRRLAASAIAKLAPFGADPATAMPALCDSCFDEVYLDRRNFDTKVELNKTITAKAGTLVQSDGERLIADWLAAHHIAYRYDERYRILSGHAIRPDFYLPELDVYLEYWGMDTVDYKIGMLKKQQLYQQEDKRLISIHPPDKPRLDTLLRHKLALFGYTIPPAT